MLPLAETYLTYLDAVKSLESNRQLLAGWSNRSWALDVCKVLGTLADCECLNRLRLVGDKVDMEQDQQDASLWFSLAVSTASHRCWSMAMHSELPPDQWFGVLAHDGHTAGMAFTKLNTCFRIINKAQDSLRGTADQALSAKAKEVGKVKPQQLISFHRS